MIEVLWESLGLILKNRKDLFIFIAGIKFGLKNTHYNYIRSYNNN